MAHYPLLEGARWRRSLAELDIQVIRDRLLEDARAFLDATPRERRALYEDLDGE